MRKLIFAGAAIAALAIPSAAMADTSSTTFSSPSFTAGEGHMAIHDHDGWKATGEYDMGIVANGINGQSLRMSNAITSGSFGDWVFSKPVAEPVGETTDHHTYFSEFTFESATGVAQGTTEYPLQISASPDNGEGGRMSFVRLVDSGSGIDVKFSEPASDGTFSAPRDIATGLDYARPHTVRFKLVTKPGPNNDQVKVWVDGKLAANNADSWEQYYRAGENKAPGTVDRMLFQARSGGGTAPATDGEGFLIDNVSVSTSV